MILDGNFKLEIPFIAYFFPFKFFCIDFKKVDLFYNSNNYYETLCGFC